MPGDAPVVDIASAIMLLSEHKKQRAGTKRRGWTPAPLPGIAEVQAEILRKLAALKAWGGEAHGGGGLDNVLLRKQEPRRRADRKWPRLLLSQERSVRKHGSP